MAKHHEEKMKRRTDQKNTAANDQHPLCKQLKSILFKLFLIMRYYIDWLIDTLFALYYDPKRESLPPPQDISVSGGGDDPNIIVLSAITLAAKIRQRQLTCEQVVSAFIARIRAVNPLVNAVVDDRFEEALEEAHQIDKDIANGTIIDVDFNEKPLLGVPFTTKESTACKGLSYTFGLVRRKGRRARVDADVIASVKRAGGILLAVTNVPQLNMWQETSNPVYGLTRNPYNVTRNVGGSSGGEASILAACGSPIGIGSDIGGSIRIPCFMCGIFGHKPTCDLISTNGLTFRTGKEPDSMVVPGPMTRHAEDLAPLLKVLLGANANKLQLDRPIHIKDIKVYYVRNPQDPFVSPFRDEMKHVFEKTINCLAELLPDDPILVHFDHIQYGGKLWRYWMTKEPNYDFKRDITNREGKINSIFEICKYIGGRSEFTAAVIFNLINALLPPENEDWIREITAELRKDIIDTLGSDGVLLYPCAPFSASYHHTALLRPWNFHLFAIWNALKLPVTQVPLGLSSANGLPLGIQIIAAPYQDHLCLAVAKVLEKQLGGFVPPFKVDKV